jgi:ABC-type transport system substrate-binding protein
VIGVRRQYVSSQISTTAFTNQAGVRTSQMDTLWDQAIRSTGSQYTSLYHQIQQLATSQLPYLWITETVNTRVSRSVCHGFNNQNTGLFMETAWCSG